MQCIPNYSLKFNHMCNVMKRFISVGLKLNFFSTLKVTMQEMAASSMRTIN